jgi:chemotaxis signal transduction protein
MAETARFDWQAARARMARAEARLTAAEAPTEAEVRSILRQRAIALAKPLVKPVADDLIDLVVFRLGDERYAIAAGQVGAAIAIGKPLPVPGAPSFYLGLIGHRGLIYPLVDIRPLLGVRAAAPHSAGHALIIGSDKTAVAVAADAVEDFRRLDSGSIRRAPVDQEELGLVRGLLADSTVVLDTGRLLADARLVVNDQPMTRSLAGGSSS